MQTKCNNNGMMKHMQRFKKVMTVEINFSDPLIDGVIDEDDRRYASLAWMLRARYLVDVDCWSNVFGQPLKPGAIETMICKQVGMKG